MATMATVQAQVEDEVLNRASSALQRQGMDVSQAVGVLLARVARDGGLVLEHGENSEYDAWIRAKVQEALDDPRPMISSDEVDRRADARRSRLLAEARP
jgi:DNA-damage-inducible protein J